MLVLFFGARLIPLRNRRIHIPAEIVELLAIGLKSGNQGANFRERFVFKMQKADNYVGDLDASIVNVVLDVDFLSIGAQDANECIPEDRIAQMAHMRGFIRINARMFDEHVKSGIGCRTNIELRESGGHAVAVEVHVEVSGTRGLETRYGETLSSSLGFQRKKKACCRQAVIQQRSQFGSDDLRRLSQLPREFEGDGKGEFAELEIGRLLDSDGAKLDVVLILDECADPRKQTLLQFEIHGRSPLKIPDFLDDFNSDESIGQGQPGEFEVSQTLPQASFKIESKVYQLKFSVFRSLHS